MSQLFLAASRTPRSRLKYVVIKRILADAASDEQFISMFLDEARITASLWHSGISRVLDLGQDSKGLYVAMEFIAGANLNEVFDACALKQEVLPLGFSASVVHDCALALHYAHTLRDAEGLDGSVIHRDVAQKNIMVTYEGQVKLLDFGIAKARNTLSRTKTGTVKGTAGYMSPEQVRGELVDARSDVFSLGIVLWEMITGTRLFAASSAIDEMKLILSGPIALPHEFAGWVPPSLSRVTMRALERASQDRYGSAKEFADAIATECSELLHDCAQRQRFMQSLFADRFAATQALFEAAARPDEPGLVDAAVLSLEQHSQAPQGSTTRQMPRVETTAFIVKPRSDRSTRKLKALVVTLVVCSVGGLAFKALSFERAPNSRPVDSAANVHPGLPGVDSAWSRAIQPVEKIEETNQRARGEITIAIFPEASVFRGAEKLGSGHWLTFSLPPGRHSLIAVGADGVRHRLTLSVLAGRNKPQRFRLDELPAK